MANPLKVLVDLQARRNVAVSGTLEVTGSTTLAGLTAGTTSVGSLTATGATINGNVSGSGTLRAGGAATLGSTLSVTGNTTVSSLTASSVISGTDGYFTGLYINGTPVLTGSGGGSGTVDTGVVNKLAYYSGTTTVNDAAGLTWDGSKLNVSGSSGSSLALEVSGTIVTSGSVTINDGGLTINNNTGLVVNSNGITVTSGGASITGLVSAISGLTVAGAALTSQNSTILSGSTTTSGSLEVGGGGTFTAGAGTFSGQLTANGALIVGNGVLNVNNGDISGSANIRAGGAITGSNLNIVSSATIGNGLTVSAGTAAVQALTSTGVNVTGNISGSGTLQSGGAATLAGGLTVTGAALNASAVAVSASALNITNDISARSGSFSGDVTITGNLTVLGTPTQIVSNTVNIGDKNISLGTGSADPSFLNEGGIDLGSGSVVQWRYNNASTAWKSNVDVDVASTKVYKIDGTEVLSATKLGNNVISSSLQTLGTLTGLIVNGATQLTGNLNVSGGYIYAPATGSTTNYAAAVSSGIVQITHALGLLSDAVDTKTTAAAVKSSVEAAYNKVRVAVTGAFDGNGHAEVNLVTAATALGADVAKFKGLQKHYLSIDVLVRNGSADADWENDLVAVHLSGSGAGSDTEVIAVIDALTEATEYRLIAVNEKSGSFSI
jgi:fibronectin-binding autotransporter adhesin